MTKWLLLGLAVVLMVCALISHLRGNHQTRDLFGVLGAVVAGIACLSGNENDARKEVKRAESPSTKVNLN